MDVIYFQVLPVKSIQNYFKKLKKNLKVYHTLPQILIIVTADGSYSEALSHNL